MKETQEFAGKDIDSAVKNACFELNLSKSELKYDIISTGASGIFGIVGRKNAKIRVVLPKINSRTDTKKEDDNGVQSIVDEAFGVKPKKKPPTKKASPKKTDSKKTDSKKSGKKALSSVDKKPIENKAGKPATSEDQQKPEDLKEANNKEERYVEREIVDVTQESIDLGQETLQKIINLITDDAEVSFATDRDKLQLKVNGGNSGILIGRKGQTLEAMQFLTDKIINRKSEARVRVKVDIEGYMEARKANLIQLANKMADKAKKTGRPATINQMSGQDRRIIHLTLKEDPRVRTQSKGDGYYRRLIILPKRTGSFKKKSKHTQEK
ncbi:MAG: Jag N-terminal domain-containing protein [Desulfobacteraceae bacterium]|nr:Jag N-terminal domain-containing protein [Desulfobacteraceae bacterium]